MNYSNKNIVSVLEAWGACQWGGSGSCPYRSQCNCKIRKILIDDYYPPLSAVVPLDDWRGNPPRKVHHLHLISKYDKSIEKGTRFKSRIIQQPKVKKLTRQNSRRLRGSKQLRAMR